MNLKKYKIITVETGERIHDFWAVDDKEAIKLCDAHIKRICYVHGEELKLEYVLKEELDEFNERTIERPVLLSKTQKSKKKVFYNKQEVVFYYTTGVTNEKKEAWINVVVKDGSRIELRGKAAIKMLHKLNIK